jgi:hypothetical protein
LHDVYPPEPVALHQPEPITVGPARPVRWPVLTQSWRDLTFLHWPVDATLAEHLLPPGISLDLFDGVSYVGVAAFRMEGVGLFGLPGLPYLGSFPETNVRLYSVSPDGRRGVVFRSLDAARLLPALMGRTVFRVPYRWAMMRVRRDGDVVTYASRRRWPGRSGRFRMRIKIGAPVTSPTELEHFLTARWGLHSTWYGGREFYLPNQHPPWPLYRAKLLWLEEGLVESAGLPAPTIGPVSVLYSPGVSVRFGLPSGCR